VSHNSELYLRLTLFKKKIGILFFSNCIRWCKKIKYILFNYCNTRNVLFISTLQPPELLSYFILIHSHSSLKYASLHQTQNIFACCFWCLPPAAAAAVGEGHGAAHISKMQRRLRSYFYTQMRFFAHCTSTRGSVCTHYWTSPAASLRSCRVQRDSRCPWLVSVISNTRKCSTNLVVCVYMPTGCAVSRVFPGSVYMLRTAGRLCWFILCITDGTDGALCLRCVNSRALDVLPILQQRLWINCILLSSPIEIDFNRQN
jgi:hypothetical protein